MKFTVERISSGYLITDSDAPYGELRYHVDDFVSVLKALAQNAYMQNCPDVKIWGVNQPEYEYLIHNSGLGTPATGFSYGILDPEKVKPVKLAGGVEKEFQWKNQGMRKTEKY